MTTFPGTNHLNEFYVLFVFTNFVSLNYSNYYGITMSTTNITPPVQGLVQQTVEALEKWLWQVEMKIYNLGQKSEGAKGKVHTHYQEKLIELHHTCETLEAEFASLRL